MHDRGRRWAAPWSDITSVTAEQGALVVGLAKGESVRLLGGMPRSAVRWLARVLDARSRAVAPLDEAEWRALREVQRALAPVAAEPLLMGSGL